MKNPSPPRLLATAYLPDQLLDLHGPVILFLGRSNAGKSSLLNGLFGLPLAKVSKTPGKTRSVNYYHWGPDLILVDLPGYGFAKRRGEERRDWALLVKEFFDRLPPTRAWALLLVDAKRKLAKEEEELVSSLGERKMPVEVLLTKSDRLNQAERDRCRRTMEDFLQNGGFSLTWSFVSAKKGEGLEDLRRRLIQYGKEITNQNPGNGEIRS